MFLDEIGELSLDMQVKFLGVLQERQIERLGAPGADRRRRAGHRGDAIATSNVRWRRGTFREDLYYRLNVFPIRVPPLRERIEDHPAAGMDVSSRSAAGHSANAIESISKANMAAIQRYAWPGNIRELRNVIERAMIVANGPRLTIVLPKSALATPQPSIAWSTSNGTTSAPCSVASIGASEAPAAAPRSWA